MAISTSSTSQKSPGAGPPEQPTTPRVLAEFPTRKIGNLRFRHFLLRAVTANPRYLCRKTAFGSEADKNCRNPTRSRRRECSRSRVPGSMRIDWRRSKVNQVGSRGGSWIRKYSEQGDIPAHQRCWRLPRGLAGPRCQRNSDRMASVKRRRSFLKMSNSFWWSPAIQMA